MDVTRKIKKIIWTVFPPESNVERIFRTQYHRIRSTKVFINWKIQQSKKSYKNWLLHQEKQKMVVEKSFNYEPNISFFLPLSILDLDSSIKTIYSIQAQAMKKWELIIFSLKSLPRENKLNKIIGHDQRIKFYIVEEINLQKFIELSKSDFFLCCSPGDTFENNLIYELIQKINSCPAVEIIYTDIDIQTNIQTEPLPFFKPEKYSPELHLSVNYLSNGLVKKEPAILQIEKVNSQLDFLNQEWELMFLLCERNSVKCHIPSVLVHQFRPTKDDPSQEKYVIESHFKRIGYLNPIQICKGSEIHLRWSFNEPPVSIIIPSKNSYKTLRTLIESLFEKTNYKNFEVVLVDNNSKDSNVLSYYSKITKEYPIQIIPFNEKFNYSKAINIGASISKSEILLFLNNDMEIITPDWLTELVQWAMIPEIGVVGGKLLYDNDSIQHAGVVIGLQGFVGHLYLHAPDHYFGLLGSVDWYRNISAVTGACQMVRKSVFNELGGYDEEFKLVFSDVDFCLRAIKKGYRIVYSPFAILKHLQGKSRGYTSPRRDILRGYDVFREWIIKEDPYFSRNLTYTTIPMCQIEEEGINKRIDQINERKKYLSKGK
jgi:GT2 family glycosyltransferase